MLASYKHGDKVYVNFSDERLNGIIVSDLSGTMFDKPGAVYVVRLVRGDRVFVKAISVYQISERQGSCRDDRTLTTLKKLRWNERGYSQFREHPYFYKSYSSITRCCDGVFRRRPKPKKVKAVLK